MSNTQRARLALVLIPGAYAVVTTLLYLWSPVLVRLAPWQTAALIVPQMVAAMIWLVIPAAHRWFGRFIAGRCAA